MKNVSPLLFAILVILVFWGPEQGYAQNIKDLSTDDSKRTTLFYSGLNGYFSYRIPTVIKSKRAVLVFAEGRKNSTSDFGNIDLVYRRSTNNGKSWENIQILYDKDDLAVQNPVPLYVREENKVVLLFNITSQSEHDILNNDYEPDQQRKAYMTSSVDDGLTWSTPKEITGTVKLPHWRWHAIGPVHGIQLKKGSHKGRLLAPVAISIEKGNSAYCMALIYSDDHGEHWNIGAVDTTLTDAVQSNETTIVELNNGHIYVNTRDHLGGSHEMNRGETFSTDGGLSFTSPIIESAKFPSPIVQASLLRWDSALKGKKDMLLFSTPSSIDKRENLVLMASYDEAKTWDTFIKVHHGFSAYSDMVKLNNRTLGVIYETDNYKKIQFKKIRID